MSKTPVETLSIEACLENRTFQNWLISNLVLRQTEITPDDIAFTGKSIGKGRVAERIVQLLWENTGYLVSTQAIAQHIYGFDGASERSAIISWTDQIRKRKLKKPQVLFSAREIGYAVGVSSLEVQKMDLLLMYRLWQDLMKPVPEQELATKVYGFNDESAKASVQRQTEKLRFQRLTDTSARIEMKKTPQGKEYRLTHQREQERKIPSEVHPKFLSWEFQNWLAQPQVGILEREGEESIRNHSAAFDMKTKSHLFLQVLYNCRGYIVPYTYLSYVLYRTPNEVNKVREIFSYVKDSQFLDSQQVCLLPEFGLGIGIRSFSVTPKQLQLLHLLWKDDLSAHDLAEALYGSFDTVQKKKIASLVSTTRIALREGVLQIHYEQKGEDMVYSLQTDSVGKP